MTRIQRWRCPHCGDAMKKVGAWYISIWHRAWTRLAWCEQCNEPRRVSISLPLPD